MFNAVQIWYAALSTAAKVGVVSTAVVTGTAATTVLPDSPPPAPAPLITPERAEAQPTCTPTSVSVEETETVPFTSSTENDPSTASGKSYIKTDGVDGVRTITYEITTFAPTGCDEDQKNKVNEVITTQPVNQVTAIGTYVAPPPPAPKRDNCDPNYSPCVPNVSYDLDCPEIGFSVRVIGSDPHRFDRDDDGYGCESYQ